MGSNEGWFDVPGQLDGTPLGTNVTDGSKVSEGLELGINDIDGMSDGYETDEMLGVLVGDEVGPDDREG